MKSYGTPTFDLNNSKIIIILKQMELFSHRANLVLTEIYFIWLVRCFIKKIFKFKVHGLFVFVKMFQVNLKI